MQRFQPKRITAMPVTKVPKGTPLLKGAKIILGMKPPKSYLERLAKQKEAKKRKAKAGGWNP